MISGQFFYSNPPALLESPVDCGLNKVCPKDEVGPKCLPDTGCCGRGIICGDTLLGDGGDLYNRDSPVDEVI